MSEKSTSLMIKTILGHLQNGVEKLESGQLSPEDMELLVEDAKELYERMVILRYKIYETNVLGVKEPVITASIRHTEIETPIDLFGVVDEPKQEPEFEINYSNDLSNESSTEADEHSIIEEGEEDFSADEDQSDEEIETHQEAAIKEEVVEEDSVEEEVIEEDSVEEDSVEEEAELLEDLTAEDINTLPEEESSNEEVPVSDSETTPAWEPEFSGDQPIWMAEMEANIRDNRSVFPLESLIGAFTLNEKLQFINELFDGSSDEFSSNIKQLDQLASMDAARNMIAELADTFNWDTESEIVEDFMYKICRRYATGA
jgi:hypothetical protein